MTEGEHTVNLYLNLDSKFKLVKNVKVTVEIVSAGSSSSSESDKNTSDDDANNDDSQKTDTKKPEE